MYRDDISHNYKMRKRVQAPRARSKTPASKKARFYVNPFPRYKMLTNPASSKVTQQFRCEMTYMEYGVSLDPGAGTAASYVFCANGLFDPNITGVGHQPMGFDQLIALWNQYVVIGGVIKVTFNNYDGAYGQIVGITLKDSSGTTADPRAYVEWGNTTWSNLGQLSANPTKTLTHRFDIAKFSGSDIFSDQEYSGDATSNPAKPHHLVIWAAPADAINNPSPVYANVEIMYDVVFRSPGATGLS